jgi:hypothetical protein
MKLGLVFAGAFTAVAALVSTPAQAAHLFDENGDSADILFDGFTGNAGNTIPGLSASLRLTLLAGAQSRGYLFSYVLRNTSTAGGPASRVSGFAFDSNPDVRLVATLGELSNVILDGRYPNGIGDVEICLSGGRTCQGGAGSGATHGDPASGVFLLGFDRPATSVTLSDFFVRYQGLSGLGRITSASGQEVTTAVPEPGTWLMMIFGLGAIGGAMRKRSRATMQWHLA